MGFGRRDIWRHLRAVAGINPTASAAATINGSAVDRFGSSQGADSAVLHVACGAATGSPSAQTVDGKLQDSADGSTDWQDIGDAITQLTADDTSGESPGINLSNKRRYVRSVVTVGFTGGSTPAIPVAATICLGGG
jgi:hypothetical protein